MTRTTIHSDYIPDNAITGVKIAENSITAREIATNAITTLYVADDSVTADKLANSINVDIATGVAALPKAGGTMTGNLIGTQAFFSPNTAGKNTITITTNASDDGRILIKSDTTDKVDIQANGTTYFNGGNVGIGTTSPTAPLHVDAAGMGDIYSGLIQNSTTDTDHYNVVRFMQGASGSATGYIGTGGSATGNTAFRNNFVVGTQSANALAFTTNDTERARIDSSGNLLVGKTATNTDSVGFEARATGLNAMVRASGETLVLGRNTSDGSILSFRKDGTPVGSIGSRSSGSNLYIAFRTETAGDGCGLTGSNSSTGAILPSDGNGATADNHIDLGAGAVRFKDLYLSGAVKANGIAATDVDITISNSADGIYFGSGFFRPYTADNNVISLGSSGARFKDLYLSGGVYLGGTGAANKLDDYEEGTFTPVLTRSTGGAISATYTSQAGAYTKIGNLVYFQINIAMTAIASQGSGYAILMGLPFTSNQLSYNQISHVSGNTFGSTDVEKAFTSSGVIYFGTTGATNFPPLQIAYSTGILRICGTYKTA